MRIGAIALALLAPALTAQAVDCRFSVLDHQERPLGGGPPQNLCQAYNGKVVLIVNTASRSRYASQLKGLEALYRRFRSQGLVVLGFPSDDFHHEPAGAAEVARLARSRYGVSFPLYQPIHVSGEQTDDLYRDLFVQLGVPLREDFAKILVDRNGQVVSYFGQQISPSDGAFVNSIKTQIEQPAVTGG
ncbi:MAG: glutathione peroxidase [Gammaproteobacteria bacterium]|nr:glutathione peroxidase [Gammaproteobacteria bacterium]